MFKKIMNLFKGGDEKNSAADEKKLAAPEDENTPAEEVSDDFAGGPELNESYEVAEELKEETVEPETEFSETALSATSSIVEDGGDAKLDFQEKGTQKSWFARLKERMTKTKNTFMRKLGEVFGDRMAITPETLERLEEILIESDISARTTQKIIVKMQERLDEIKVKNMDELTGLLREIMTGLVEHKDTALNIEGRDMSIILVVGVNGVGKTTTIGKIAKNLTAAGKKVMIVAGDTFRAGAIEQAEIWAKRVHVPIVKAQPDSDPAAVVYDAIKAGKARGTQVLIIDTAGRLHTKFNLMEELKKIRKVIVREIPDGPHELLQVLDGTTGQNALVQAKTFNEAMGVTGLVLTKLDGTAKGGIVITICDELKIPIKLIGIGEGIDDLKEFNGPDFVKAIFE